MNLKQLAGDIALLAATRMIARFFSISVATPPFEDHLAATQIVLPELDGLGTYRFPVNGLAEAHTGEIRVIHWKGAEAPVLIWHQGGGERPFDLTISRMFPEDRACDINVIAVKSPFQDSLADANRYFDHLHNYIAMMASTVRITELLLTQTPLVRSTCKMVGGYSLGGIVSNRHRVEYGTADLYFPFMAGTRHGDIFMKAVSIGRAGRNDPAAVVSRLNFDLRWQAANPQNVYPVLGSQDLLNRMSAQGPSYGQTPYEVWKGGHLYGAARPHLLRQKIYKHLAEFLDTVSS